MTSGRDAADLCRIYVRMTSRTDVAYIRRMYVRMTSEKCDADVWRMPVLMMSREVNGEFRNDVNIPTDDTKRQWHGLLE